MTPDPTPDSRDESRAGWLGSIGSRLVLAFTGISILTLLVVGVMFYALLGGYVIDRQKDQLIDQATQVSEQIQALSGTMPNLMSRNMFLGMLLRSDLRLLPSGAGIVIYQGNEVSAKSGVLPVREQNLDRLRTEGEQIGGTSPGCELVRSLLSAAGRRVDLLVAAAPLVSSDGSRGLVVVTLTTNDAFATRRGLVRVLLPAGIIAVVLAVALGLGLGSWMGRPLRRLSAAARHMARGFYDRPVTGTYPGEVQELANSLEFMRREVHHSEESLRAFVGSAAHELRTPLTSIQGFSQALLDGTAASDEERQRSAAAIYRESTRLRRLVDALLTLSRYDSGEFHPNNTRVAVKTLATEEVDRLVQIGFAPPGRVALSFPTEVSMVTDADMLRQVIANLLKNAVQYGGDDSVELAGWVSGRNVIIRVTNGGLPLTSEERARLFSRFFRGREALKQEGFGLGLTLVREICTVLGGRVELVGSGPATVFEVVLPLEPSHPNSALMK
jgi:signal transduction histidine kinase